MIKFLLYLFESGLCLTLLILVYFFFLRKETYFRFNRAYLISIMMLSFLIPFMHIHINVNDTKKYESALNGIGKFRNYYEQLIAMSDPDYYPYNKQHKTLKFEETGVGETVGLKYDKNTINPALTFEAADQNLNKPGISLTTLIFILYLFGVLILLTRIILLFRWIYITTKTHPKEKWHGINIIKLDKNLPPFSFINYVFLNKDLSSKNKLEQILAHEKEHIRQLHSFDLLLAHFVAIIQWFNPFVWVLQKAIKTNHEYLADRKVVRQGYNLFDYQELLLKQFITIPSVQLVNNFNLISIKNRIYMMNKIKSGFVAKLKALLIIPTAIFTFILFANLTLNGPGNVLTNLSFFEIQNNMNQLKGLWINTSNDNYGYQVLFENQKFSVIDHKIELKEYPYQLQGNQIVLSARGNEEISIKYEVSNGQLKIWWNQTDYSLYKKSEYNNSLDDYLAAFNESINLPVIENYGLLQRLDLCIDVAMVNDRIYVNKVLTDYTKLKDALIKEKSRINHLDAQLITIRIFADKNLSMDYMNKLNQVLRQLGLLKVAHMGKVNDDKVSKLQRGFIGMAKKLPPLEGIEIIPDEELTDQGITLFEMDATNPENSPNALKPKFEQVLTNSDKYIADLYYDKTTIFNTYIGYQDMARSVVYEFRNRYATDKYNLTFDELSSIQQKEIRKIYPLIISEARSFKEE